MGASTIVIDHYLTPLSQSSHQSHNVFVIWYSTLQLQQNTDLGGNVVRNPYVEISLNGWPLYMRVTSHLEMCSNGVNMMTSCIIIHENEVCTTEGW